jgi:hypothetical protein
MLTADGETDAHDEVFMLSRQVSCIFRATRSPQSPSLLAGRRKMFSVFMLSLCPADHYSFIIAVVYQHCGDFALVRAEQDPSSATYCET